MPSTKSIKQRIKSVRNTAQITKAMEVVSATKMRRSQEFAVQARPYATASLELLRNLLLRMPEGAMPPLLAEREEGASLLLVVTSDKGLAGAFNANVLRKAEQWLSQPSMDIARPYIVAVGKKAKDHFDRKGQALFKSFGGYGDYSTVAETMEVSDAIINGFLNGSWNQAYAVYTNFRTTLVQEAVMKRILPATPEGLEDAIRGLLPERGRFSESGIRNPRTRASTVRGRQESGARYNYEYKIEPSPTEVLNALVPQLIRIHIHHVILESNASEHSARMVAMKNASDNAGDLIGTLTLAFNKARQAGITRELTEITAGKEALEG